MQQDDKKPYREAQKSTENHKNASGRGKSLQDNTIWSIKRPEVQTPGL